MICTCNLLLPSVNLCTFYWKSQRNIIQKWHVKTSIKHIRHNISGPFPQYFVHIHVKDSPGCSLVWVEGAYSQRFFVYFSKFSVIELHLELLLLVAYFLCSKLSFPCTTNVSNYNPRKSELLLNLAIQRSVMSKYCS